MFGFGLILDVLAQVPTETPEGSVAIPNWIIATSVPIVAGWIVGVVIYFRRQAEARLSDKDKANKTIIEILQRTHEQALADRDTIIKVQAERIARCEDREERRLSPTKKPDPPPKVT
jgi:hypothetical protein